MTSPTLADTLEQLAREVELTSCENDFDHAASHIAEALRNTANWHRQNS